MKFIRTQRKYQLFSICTFLSLIIVLQQSCTKVDTRSNGLNKESSSEKFFRIPVGTDPLIQKIADVLKHTNSQTEFITAFSNHEGFAIWNKANFKTVHRGAASFTGTGIPDVDTIITIPLILNGADIVNGYLQATLNGDISVSLFRRSDYTLLPFGNLQDAGYNADKYQLSMMLFDKQIFGYKKFKVIDKRLFKNVADTSKQRVIELRDTSVAGNNLNEASGCSTTIYYFLCSTCGKLNCPYTQNIVFTYCGNGDDGTPQGGGNPGGLGFPIITGGGGGNPYPGQSNTPPPGFPPPRPGIEPFAEDDGYENHIIIDSLRGFPCAQDVLRQLPNVEGKVKEILHDVFGVTDSVNLKFSAGIFPIADSLLDAFTPDPLTNAPNDYRIYLNVNLLTSATKDYIASVIIHEAIHAYIMRKKQTLSPANFELQFPIYGLYSTIDSAHHNQMANSYIAIMKQAIRAVNTTVTDYNAEALAWGGLEETTAWLNRADTVGIKIRYSSARFPNRSYIESSVPVNYQTYGYLKCP